MTIIAIIIAVFIFCCGYYIRPYVDELKEISRIEKDLKEFVNEGKNDEQTD